MNTMSRSLKSVVLVLPLLMLSACSDDGAVTPEPGLEDVDNTAAIGAGDADQYFGYFERPCNPEFRDSGSVTISADELVQIDTVFDDANCTQPSQEQVVTYSAVFPGGTTTTELGEAIHIDQTLETWVIDGELINGMGANSTAYQIIFHDGIFLYLADGRGDTAAERPGTLSSVAYIRQ